MKNIPPSLLMQSKILVFMLAACAVIYIWLPNAFDMTLIRNIVLTYAVIVVTSGLITVMTPDDKDNNKKP
ncbi:MAG TPA: hypothetical protein VHP34_06970 [Alphaproteobacteria bacterium]|nr:hypothetical protein [Alphaproteobacteria bacterium]